MEIVLLRHGKPKIENSEYLTAAGFGQWIAAYNEAGIDTDHAPSRQALAQAQACSVVVCNHLPRSIESARMLGVTNIEAQDALFRECDMPYADWRYPRLSVPGWSSVFRILQLMGYSSNAESFREARQRACSCALRLRALAANHESVLFVGHGLLNWLLAGNLLRTGWIGPKSAGRQYWDYGVYRHKPV